MVNHSRATQAEPSQGGFTRLQLCCMDDYRKVGAFLPVYMILFGMLFVFLIPCSLVALFVIRRSWT